MDRFIYKNNKSLRYGYTTGSCAAAAAKAALCMVLEGKEIPHVKLTTPKGWELTLEVEEIRMGNKATSCAVRKDSGDDPDVTDGLLIHASVSLCDEGIHIAGGEGVGRVTQPGLQVGVGKAAINPVPLAMIEESLRSTAKSHGYLGGIQVEITVPKGREIAGRTFNEKLGIVGGISILGTSGIVEPMSEKALVDSFKLEMGILRQRVGDAMILCPGNFGWQFSEDVLKLDMNYAQKISNYVGEAFDHAVQLECKKILFVAHLGKAVKLAGGIMNTHSRMGDCRMEILAAQAIREGADPSVLNALLDAVSTDAAIEILENNHLMEPVMDRVIRSIQENLTNRVGGRLEIGLVLFSFSKGLLGMNEKAKLLIEELKL